VNPRALLLTAGEIAALLTPEVPAEDVQLYCVLRTFRNSTSGDAWPSRPTLAACVGIQPRAITRRIQHLEELGLLECRRSLGRPTRYTFPRMSSVADDTSAVDDTSDADDREVVSSDAKSSVVDDTRTKPRTSKRNSPAGEEPGSPTSTPDNYPEHVREAAHSLSRWSSKQITPAAVAEAAADSLPSELARAVENLCSRDPLSVISPLTILARRLADERKRRDPIA
jgi:hypothetical protein